MTAPADGAAARLPDSAAVKAEFLVALQVPLNPLPDGGAFKNAMARLTGAVAVAACSQGGRPHGLLVSSLIALSVEPPRVLFCIRKAAGAHGALLSADKISLAVLGEAHLDEAEVFTAQDRVEERFLSSLWRHEPGAPPQLDGALVRLEGAIYQRICVGTHTIFIVNVERSSHADGDPLLYVDREFRTLTVD